MDLEQRIAQLSPAKLALLEQKLKKNKPEGRPRLQTVAGHSQKYWPLSFSQERLWFLEQMEPDSCLYNLPAILPLRGGIDPRLVEECVRQVVARHSSLRTRFVVKDDDPSQVISDDVSEALDFSTIDLRGAGAQSGLSQTLNDEIWVPFDLASGPLLRARLVLQRNNENFLLLVMHHIISDGWSINIFFKEFAALYESASSGSPPDLPPLPQQYVDYSLSQRQSLAGARLASLLSYWRGQLDDAPSVMALPLDHPRPARQSFKGALYPFNISRSSLQNLKSVCNENGVVPFMVLLSIFKVLLFRYTNQSKIVVGTPIANRGYSELEALIGFFTNTVVLCSSMSASMTFRELLARIRETTLGAYEHQELPFEKLVVELQPERSLSHNPIFQVMFTFQNLPAEKAVTAERPESKQPPPDDPLSLDFKFSKFDLTLAMTETDDGVSAVFEYATDLFDADTIERMAVHLVNILEHLLQNPDEQLDAFSFLSEDERKLVVEQWNDTERKWPEILPLHGRFEKWVRETPDATAVMFRETALSYRELDRRAGIIAGLLQGQGVGRGSIVGICLPRSLEMVIGLFAILKAGAAYMPIEPDFPADRVAYMLEDAKVTHLLTVSECRNTLRAHKVKTVILDEFEFDGEDGGGFVPPAIDPTDPAYVLFTSGSSGRPKGVVISHGAIYNRLQWMQEAYRLGTDDRVMQKTPYTFDVSVWEFFWTLSEGACLVVAEPERHKESAYLADLIKKQQITCLHFVPSMLQLFLHEDLSDCGSLRRIICSGEALGIEQCRRLQSLPGVSAHNLYGPTEAAVDVTHWDCDEWRDQYLSVPIGRPIANTQIYILNEKRQPCPIGVPGELYIGGQNLAAGYLNKPELTVKQFIPDPFAKDAGARLYKTGDLARFRNDGNIEYIGRIDSQVKLRGLRIELGEIESVLRQYPGVAEAVVIVYRFGDHDERLAAYVVSDDAGASINADEIAVFIGKKLPNYMVPSTIMAIPELPLTANGKLDRKGLPKPAAVRTAAPMEPVSDIEKELLGIWRKFLKVDSLHTNDDFFALGGHSILVTQVINGINARYRLNVPVRLLFENPTVKALARALSEFEDEAWLDESGSASAMLMRSDLRLLQVLEELSEEQIDDFLKQWLAAPGTADFDSVESLAAWSRNYLNGSEVKTKAETNNGAFADDRGVSSSGHIEEPLGQAYLSYYPKLVQIRIAIEGIDRSRCDPFFMLANPDGADEDQVARLREQGSQVFESYAQLVGRQLSEKNGTLPPGELMNYCRQLMVMADLASSIGSFNGRIPDKG